jgi:hypothetical protein
MTSVPFSFSVPSGIEAAAGNANAEGPVADCTGSSCFSKAARAAFAAVVGHRPLAGVAIKGCW